MKLLSTLLHKLPIVARAGAQEVEVSDLCYDSRQVAVGSCFFAVKGTATDGHRFIAMAVERGARAVVCQELPEEIHPEVAYVDENGKLINQKHISIVTLFKALENCP
mgnify:CR=1 FL=1